LDSIDVSRVFLNDRCLTLNANAHQRSGTLEQISGSLGGVDVQSMFFLLGEPFIERSSNFTYIIAELGRCAPK
jgi:hypothetical protein